MEKIVRKSILVITERYNPERFLINDLVKEWKNLGINIHVLTQVPSYPEDTIYPGYSNTYSRRLEDGIYVTRFKTLMGYKKSIIRKIANYILFMLRASWHSFFLASSVDSVFCYQTGPLSQAFPLVILKLFFHKRTCIWTQDVWPDTVFAYGFPDSGVFAHSLKWFVRFIYLFIDEILVSSPGFVHRLGKYLPEKKRAVFIPQWAADNFIHGIESGFEFPKNKYKFIFAGTVGKMQNLEPVVRAFGKVSSDKVLFYILGDGSNKFNLKNIVEVEGIENVVFLNSIEENKVKHCLQQSDFLVLPLSGNPLINLTIPAKFQAYLSAGKPIFAVAKGEVKNLVEQEHIGLVSDPDNIDDIVRGITSLIAMSDSDIAEYTRNMNVLLNTQYNKDIIIKRMTERILLIDSSQKGNFYQDNDIKEKVSIITPLHNAEEFIMKTAESVLSQTYKNFEWLIVDDCSTDMSRSILKKLSETDKRIKVFSLDKNIGPAQARNYAIRNATGRFIAFLDSDDLWLPKKLEKQVAFMKGKGAVLSCTQYKKLNKDGSIKTGKIVPVPNTASYIRILHTDSIMASSAMYDRLKTGDILEPEDAPWGRDDYCFFLMILKKHRYVYCVPEDLSRLRTFGESLTGNKLKVAKKQWIFYRRYLKLSLLSSVEKFIVYAYQGLKKYLFF